MIQSASIVADKKAVLEAFIESSGNGSAVEESQDLLEEALLAFKAATQSICPGLEPALAELKGFKSCPGGERGVKILSACSILLEKNKSVPDSLPRSWEACRNMIKCPRSFLARMKAFQPERITEHNASLVANILNDPECTYESVKRVSSGLAALRNWVANIYKYHCIYAKIKELIGVGPLGEAAAEAAARIKELQIKVGQSKAFLLQCADDLSVTDILEIKKARKLPPGVLDVYMAAAVLLGEENKTISWKQLKAKYLASPKLFVGGLKNLISMVDNGDLPVERIDRVKPIVELGNFNPSEMKRKASAACGTCDFINVLVAYYEMLSQERLRAVLQKIRNPICMPPPTLPRIAVPVIPPPAAQPAAAGVPSTKEVSAASLIFGVQR